MKAERPGVEPRPFESRVQHPNNYTASETRVPKFQNLVKIVVGLFRRFFRPKGATVYINPAGEI